MSKTTVLIKNELDGGKIEEIVISKGSISNPEDVQLLRRTLDLLNDGGINRDKWYDLCSDIVDRLREIEDV